MFDSCWCPTPWSWEWLASVLTTHRSIEKGRPTQIEVIFRLLQQLDQFNRQIALYKWVSSRRRKWESQVKLIDLSEVMNNHAPVPPWQWARAPDWLWCSKWCDYWGEEWPWQSRHRGGTWSGSPRECQSSSGCPIPPGYEDKQQEINDRYKMAPWYSHPRSAFHVNSGKTVHQARNAVEIKG